MGLSCLGCDYYPFKSDPPDSPYFQIKVDSLTVLSRFKVDSPPLTVLVPGHGKYIRRVPTTSPLAASDTMRVGFYAAIGPDRCHLFSHFDTTRINLVGYKVSVWGRRYTGICPLEVSDMRGYPPLEFYPPLRAGTWIFLVSQPDGSVLRKEVVVRR